MYFLIYIMMEKITISESLRKNINFDDDRVNQQPSENIEDYNKESHACE